MSDTKMPILLFGPTGYMGGSVLIRLLEHPQAESFDITVYMRNAKKAELLEQKFGVKAVVGTNQKHDKVTALVEKAHVVVQLADSDDILLVKAILRGMQQRHTDTGDVPILLHTSGTGLLVDDARGEYATETIYDDLDVEQLKSIPPNAIHREIDLLVIDADIQGYARTHIILPSTVYGIANHALVDAGISNSHSMQLPVLIGAALGRKRAGVVGKGKSYWPDVHIYDCADLYVVLFDSIITSPDKTGHGWEGISFAENGEHSWYALSKTIGQALVALGICLDAEPTPFTVEEFHKYFKFPGDRFDPELIGWSFGTNSRCRANRARSIGWKPKYTTEDLFKSVRPEVEAFIRRSSL